MIAFRLMICALFVLTASDPPQVSQGAVQNYRRAAQEFRAHTNGDFLHDDSHDGIDALKNMWRASAQAVVEAVSRRPDASIADLNAALANFHRAQTSVVRRKARAVPLL